MHSSAAPTMAPDVRRAGWVLHLSIVEIVVTLGTAALVTIGGSSDAVSCPAFPSCLADQSTLVASVHQAAAGLLLLLALAIVVLAVPIRRGRPSVFLPALLGLVALLVTAIFGMLFASGAIPLAYAPIQFALLAVVVGLFLEVAYSARRRVQDAAPGDPAGIPPPPVPERR